MPNNKCILCGEPYLGKRVYPELCDKHAAIFREWKEEFKLVKVPDDKKG